MRRRRRRGIRLNRRGDALVAAALLWPDKLLADIAIPTALLILFVLWREAL